MSAELAIKQCVFCGIETDEIPYGTPFEINPCCPQCLQVKMKEVENDRLRAS